MKDLPVPADAAVLMKHILSYAPAYELRNNLYDYHLDEDKTITLTNWKENLKWHYVQYTNVYNLALSSFVARATPESRSKNSLRKTCVS